tara:strand:+ start:283 stop:435 length:153 start_codon:yes stop_codon:yes gene_type:complete
MLELATPTTNSNHSLQINSCRINMPSTLLALAMEVDMNMISISPIAIPKM